MIEYIKSLKWIDYFFLCLLDPRRLVNLIARNEGSPFFQGIFVVLIAGLFEIMSLSIIGTESGFFYYKLTYGWIMLILILFANIIIFSSLIDLFCQFRKHQGQIKITINLINFSFFPVFFMLPAVFIFAAINFAPVFFYVLFFILFHLWQAMIIIQGISEIHQIKFGESLLAFFTPLFTACAVIFLIMVLSVINFFGFISA